MRRAASIAAMVIGILLIVGGLATWFTVSDTLAAQQITVSDDASCLAGDDVDGPFSAYCEAKVIEKHALEATGGLFYAELDREDPLREVAASSSFLQASLFTSVVAFGVAGMAILVGVLFVLIGLGHPGRRRAGPEPVGGSNRLNRPGGPAPARPDAGRRREPGVACPCPVTRRPSAGGHVSKPCSCIHRSSKILDR